jgi:hypothetical protein
VRARTIMGLCAVSCVLSWACGQLLPAASARGVRADWRPKTPFPGEQEFEFQRAAGTLRCVIQGPITRQPGANPGFVRCDGTLVGGNRAAIAHQKGVCAADGRRAGIGSVIGGLDLLASGPGFISCVSDAVDNGPVIPVGATVKDALFSCTASSTALTCRSSSGHGFVFGDTTWRTF